MKAEDIISIDEFGVYPNLVREYGRSPVGERAYGQRPLKKGKRFSTVGALTVNGLEEGFTFEGSMNEEKFLYFIEEYLVPILRPGHIVLLDNLTCHYAEDVQEAIVRTGATVEYIPRYSPEFNPIEECWSKVKNFLRKAAAWTKEELYQAISEAFESVTPDDALGWIAHAGYCSN